MIIQNFKKIRRDGNIIDESMRAKEMLALGWGADKVLEIQWNNDSQRISLKAKYGILGIVVPGREFVAAIEEQDESGQNSTLAIIDVSGATHIQLSNNQRIQGADEAGQFCWFEPARIAAANIFGVIFCKASDSSMHQLDIDALSGSIVGEYPVR